METRSVLAAYDEQIRRGGGAHVEREPNLVRTVPAGEGWAGVTWSGLDAASADAVIAAQIERFARRPGPWEWKHYSHDEPADLAERLLRAGFTPEPPETLLVAELADLDLDVPFPDGVELLDVTGQVDVNALVSVHDEVFGGDHSAIGREIMRGLADGTVAAAVAVAGGVPVSAGRVEFHAGTDFASLWGGGTTTAWRGRGIFRALVAHRARQAAARGFRYVQVDASADSRPILRRLGFSELATTTPFIHPGGPPAAR